MKREKQEGWYSKRLFPHLDVPMGFEQAKRLVSDPVKIVRHSFKPFIGYTDKRRKFTPKSEKYFKNKTRPIKYCSHHDGYIHSYYAKKLVDSYGLFLSQSNWGKCVIGYRSGMGTNIHMAKNAFSEIRRRDSSVAIALDISDFFGSIDHATLLDKLTQVLGCERLPEDWFKIFQSMTKYAWVESEDLVKLLSIDSKKPPRPLCTIEKFRELRETNASFVQRNNEGHGIPQGSPISAVLSNVYMIDFDATCFEYVRSIGGYFRRYSDDIFVVCDPECEAAVQEFIETEISKLGSAIYVSTDKTEISHFSRPESGLLVCDQPISYLGFTFDGTRTTLRARTLSRYYRRMTYASRRTARAARTKFSAKIFKRKLYRQFSHLGKSNFYTYAKRASRILGDEAPKRQLRRHFRILHRKLSNRGK